MKGIADTGFIVAFGNANDRHHAWGLEVAKGITEPLLNCEAVLAEAAFHLGSSVYVLALVQDEMLRLAFDGSRNLQAANRTRKSIPRSAARLGGSLPHSDERGLSAPRGDHCR